METRSQVIHELADYYRDHPDAWANLCLGSGLAMVTCRESRRHMHKLLLISLRSSIGAAPDERGSLTAWSQTHTLADAIALLRLVAIKEESRERQTAARLKQVEALGKLLECKP